MLKEVTLVEIEAIFAITDRLGISREALAIPLLPRSPGRVRRVPGGRIEIVVDAGRDFAEFLASLEGELTALASSPPPRGGPGGGGQ
jgi:hypothetical protein